MRAPVTQQQVPVQFVQSPSKPDQGSKVPRYHGRTVVVLSVIQIVLGVVCIGSNSAGLALESALMGIGYGIWGGMLFVVSGIVGIWAGIKKTRCLIIFCTVLCVLTPMVGLVLLIFSSIGMAVEPSNLVYQIDSPYSTYSSVNSYDQWIYNIDNSNLSARWTTNGLVLAASFLQIVIAFIVSGMGCCTLCCCAVQEGTVLSSTALTHTIVVGGADGGNVQLLLVQGQETGQPTLVQPQAQTGAHIRQHDGYEVPVRQTNSLGPPGYFAPSLPSTDTEDGPPHYEQIYDSIHETDQYEQIQHSP